MICLNSQVLPRRNIITEPSLSALLATITQECRRGISSQALSELDKRDQMEREALERDLHSTDDASISLPGRQSGDKEWRKSRLELGSDSLSSSSCPVRKCIDEHVTRIYNAFCPVLSQFVKEENPKIKAIKALEFFKKILMDLKNTPFKTRKASINSASNTVQAIVHQLLPSFAELLNALSLKSKADPDGRVDICLAGDPVKTSLGLPVVLDALDDMIQNLRKIDNFVEDSLSLPLLKLNRIHSGFVRASGEELPVGIVSFFSLAFVFHLFTNFRICCMCTSNESLCDSPIFTNFRPHQHLMELAILNGKNLRVQKVLHNK